MPNNISITVDYKEALKSVKRIQKNQIPFAASQALNDVVFEASKALKSKAPLYLDRPTPFTIRGFRFKKSTKRNLTALVYIAPTQAAYLHYQVEGGIKRKETAVPVNVKLNKYGNIPGKKRGLKRNTRQYFAIVNGIYGLWERSRRGNKIKLIVRIHKVVKYDKKRLPFYSIVRRSVAKQWQRAFLRRYNAALKTAR